MKRFHFIGRLERSSCFSILVIAIGIVVLNLIVMAILTHLSVSSLAKSVNEQLFTTRNMQTKNQNIRNENFDSISRFKNHSIMNLSGNFTSETFLPDVKDFYNSRNPIRKSLNVNSLRNPVIIKGPFNGDTCKEFYVSSFANATVGPCGSIWNETHIIMWSDFPCKEPCNSFCPNLYNTYFRRRSIVPLNLSSSILRDGSVTVIEEPVLVPILFFWGHAFPHVVKDVMPRVAMMLPFLESNINAKLLLDYSGSVERFLKRLQIPESRILYTKFHSPDTRSLYSRESIFLYRARELALPHCHPGPLYTGNYAPEIYKQLRNQLVRADELPKDQRKLIIYVSREGGHNSSKRRIDNERELIDALKQSLDINFNGKENYTLLEFIGTEYGLDEAIEIFRNALVVLGPHGGGFYNIISSASDTLILELSPDDYGKNEVSKFASNLRLDYRGFVKKGMKRSDGFGKVNVEWINSIVLNYLDSKRFPKFRPTPKEYIPHNRNWK